jgi:hypothetical protein
MKPTQQHLPLDGTGRSAEWRLDARTREVGRRGLADARAALAEAARRSAKREARRRLHPAA